MAWWKGTADDDGNWDRDIVDLRAELMATDPEFARREREIEKRWAHVMFEHFKKSPDVLKRFAKDGFVKIR